MSLTTEPTTTESQRATLPPRPQQLIDEESMKLIFRFLSKDNHNIPALFMGDKASQLPSNGPLNLGNLLDYLHQNRNNPPLFGILLGLRLLEERMSAIELPTSYNQNGKFSIDRCGENAFTGFLAATMQICFESAAALPEARSKLQGLAQKPNTSTYKTQLKYAKDDVEILKTISDIGQEIRKFSQIIISSIDRNRSASTPISQELRQIRRSLDQSYSDYLSKSFEKLVIETIDAPGSNSINTPIQVFTTEEMSNISVESLEYTAAMIACSNLNRDRRFAHLSFQPQISAIAFDAKSTIDIRVSRI